jgi:hypothetical protein
MPSDSRLVIALNAWSVLQTASYRSFEGQKELTFERERPKAVSEPGFKSIAPMIAAKDRLSH